MFFPPYLWEGGGRDSEAMCPGKSPKKHLYQISWKFTSIQADENGYKNVQDNQEKYQVGRYVITRPKPGIGYVQGLIKNVITRTSLRCFFHLDIYIRTLETNREITATTKDMTKWQDRKNRHICPVINSTRGGRPKSVFQKQMFRVSQISVKFTLSYAFRHPLN